MSDLSAASTESPNLCRISGRMKVCAVIGDPVEHSLSPAIHNAAFKALGIDYVYVAFRVRREQLNTAIAGIKSLGLAGANVTMPHKTRVLRFLDTVDKVAREIGAVNTIVRDGSRLRGYNTDGDAALSTLMSLGGPLAGSTAVILGAGGAARSIAYHISKVVKNLAILNRTRSKASNIAAEVRMWSATKCRPHSLNRASLETQASRADLIINTLPVDVFPPFGRMLIQEKLIRPGMLVFDLNYHRNRDFLSEAHQAGAKVTDGLDMLIAQAALSFRLWTGKEPPIDVMRQSAIQARGT